MQYLLRYEKKDRYSSKHVTNNRKMWLLPFIINTITLDTISLFHFSHIIQLIQLIPYLFSICKRIRFMILPAILSNSSSQYSLTLKYIPFVPEYIIYS